MKLYMVNRFTLVYKYKRLNIKDGQRIIHDKKRRKKLRNKTIHNIYIYIDIIQ